MDKGFPLVKTQLRDFYILYDAYLPEITAIGRHLEAIREALTARVSDFAFPYPLPSYSENLTIIVWASLAKFSGDLETSLLPDATWNAYLKTYLDARSAAKPDEDRRHKGERKLGGLDDDTEAFLKVIQKHVAKSPAAKYLWHGKKLNKKLLIAFAITHTAQQI